MRINSDHMEKPRSDDGYPESDSNGDWLSGI